MENENSFLSYLGMDSPKIKESWYSNYFTVFVLSFLKPIVSLILHALVVNSPWDCWRSTFNKSGLGKLRHDFMRFFTALFWP